jgi:hypothetical protein
MKIFLSHDNVHLSEPAHKQADSQGLSHTHGQTDL